MISHRAPHVVPFRAFPFGMCKWCGGFITNAAGEIDRRRSWHRGARDRRDCLGEYQISWPGVFRSRVKERDGGVCALCPAGTAPCDTPANPVAWHADHIVPLVDGGTWSLDNAQTLCERHHAAKTAAENSARASRPLVTPEQLAFEAA